MGEFIKLVSRGVGLSSLMVLSACAGPMNANSGRPSPAQPAGNVGAAAPSVQPAIAPGVARNAGDRIALNAGRGTVTLDSSGVPYIKDGNAMVAPGETITLRFIIGDGVLQTPAAIAVKKEGGAWINSPCLQTVLNAAPPSAELKNAMPLDCGAGAANAADRALLESVRSAPPGTMIVSYAQDPNGVSMVLRIVHNLSAMVKYDLLIEQLDPRGIRVIPTTTCPSRPLLVNYENWPYPIGRILFTNVRVLALGDSLECN